MHDLAFVVFLFGLIILGFRQPFLFVLGYTYVDIVSPQRLSYYLINSVPISLIFFLLAVGGWLIADDKRGTRVSVRQALMIILLVYCGYTTATADFHAAALAKWDWVWKALVFAIFLPFTLKTRLRMEALLLFMVVSAGSIIIVGGMKTLASGGGYGSLSLGLDDNSGLYEGSIISTVAIAIIPVILFLARHVTLFTRDWKTQGYSLALCFACLLIPIGTEARTGLICIGLLGVLSLRDAKRRLLWGVCMAATVALAIPFLPQTYTQRMHTIQGYQADQSASTRLAVWAWTWDYVQSHPGGGGFNAYLQNRLTIRLTTVAKTIGGTSTTADVAYDKARAYHSSYFEMLGEQGYFGFSVWIALHLAGLVRTERLRRRYKAAKAESEIWLTPLATALQHAHLIYLAGAAFVGIAFQPFIYMLVAVEIGLDAYIQHSRPVPGVKPLASSARSYRSLSSGILMSE